MLLTKRIVGVSDTRNLGLKQATGYYTMFSDDDDYMERDYIESYINENDKDYDIIIGGYIRKTYGGKVLFKRKLQNKEISPYVLLASWAKLYKTSFLKENGFYFLKTAIADDSYFNIFAYNKTAKIKVIENTGYYWMYNENSLSNTDSKSLNRTDDLIVTLNKIKNDLVPKNHELLEYFYIRTAIYYMLFSCKNVQYKKIEQSYNKLFGWLKENVYQYNKNKYIKLKNNDGELKQVKLIINIFIKLQKIRLIKPFLWIYSRI